MNLRSRESFPDPAVLAAEIVAAVLRAALEQFEAIQSDLLASEDVPS